VTAIRTRPPNAHNRWSADLGHVETTMLKPDGGILSARLDPQAWANPESWMREAGLPVGD
jgi:hypothetical protein